MDYGIYSSTNRKKGRDERGTEEREGQRREEREGQRREERERGACL